MALSPFSTSKKEISVKYHKLKAAALTRSFPKSIRLSPSSGNTKRTYFPDIPCIRYNASRKSSGSGK